MSITHVGPKRLDRYARQSILEMIGLEGQERLRQSRVLIVGCGATGTVIANHLARAGVGRLQIVDRDFVELNNLQRQMLFDEEDVANGTPKAAAAARRLQAINSEIQVEGIVADLNPDNVEALIGDVDLVLDGTDNFETRYVVNDACVKIGKPWVYCGVVSTYGMTMLVRPGVTPCLRCVFPDLPAAGSAATCDIAGVLGPSVSVVASLAAIEGMKSLLGATNAFANGLIHVDAWELSWHQFRVERRDDCRCCQKREFLFLDSQSGSRTATLCGRNTVQISPSRPTQLDLESLANRLIGTGDGVVSSNRFLVKFQLSEFVLSIFSDGRCLVQGTTDESQARSLYARYVGG